jgi:ferric-dicitrate binding protein FerR (iron transport regulator)
MKTRPDDREPTTEDDTDLVRLISETWMPPAMTPVRRARFDADLDARLARERWRLAPWIAAAVAAGAAALLVLAYTPRPADVREVADDTGTDEAFILAVAGDSSLDFEAALPVEYQAIALMLDPE